MRKVNKEPNHGITTRLRYDSYDKEVIKSINNRKGSYSSSKYGHNDVRDALDKIYHGKCCFCESKIKPVSSPHIEHFRPKSSITGVNDRGYYWLGNEWTNLLLICPSCNSSKRTQFPTTNANVVDHPVDASGAIDFSQFTYDSGHLATEESLLINPEYDEPLDFFSVNRKGELEVFDQFIRAETTIEVVGLNEDDLKVKRKKVIDKILSKLRFQLAQRYRENDRLTENQFRNQLEPIFKKLIGRKNKKKQYTMVGHYMVNNFNDLILNQLEPAFRDVIKAEFILFIDRI